MNSTVPRTRTPDIPIPNPRHAGPYPRRLAGGTGIIVGATQEDVATVQWWVYQQWRHMKCDDMRACDAASVAVALVNNSHQHTASGLDGGETTVIVERGPFISHLVVTDQGPRPGVVRPLLPELRPDRSGLRMVENLSVFWDWEPILNGGVTVRARMEMP